MEDRCRREVEELHQFFEAWFRGDVPQVGDGFERLTEVLASEFEMITPAGTRLARGPLLVELHGAHGRDVDARIRVHDFRGVSLTSELFLATYEEWQGPEGQERRRISSALFRQRGGLPHDVEWVHLHECWLPSGEV